MKYKSLILLSLSAMMLLSGCQNGSEHDKDKQWNYIVKHIGKWNQSCPYYYSWLQVDSLTIGDSIIYIHGDVNWALYQNDSLNMELSLCEIRKIVNQKAIASLESVIGKKQVDDCLSHGFPILFQKKEHDKANMSPLGQKVDRIIEEVLAMQENPQTRLSDRELVTYMNKKAAEEAIDPEDWSIAIEIGIEKCWPCYDTLFQSAKEQHQWSIWFSHELLGMVHAQQKLLAQDKIPIDMEREYDLMMNYRDAVFELLDQQGRTESDFNAVRRSVYTNIQEIMRVNQYILAGVPKDNYDDNSGTFSENFARMTDSLFVVLGQQYPYAVDAIGKIQRAHNEWLDYRKATSSRLSQKERFLYDGMTQAMQIILHTEIRSNYTEFWVDLINKNE